MKNLKTSKVAHWVKVLAFKNYNLSIIPRTNMVEGKRDTCKLTSDLCTCDVYVCIYTLTVA